jgi:hypothetical protein
MQAQEDCRGIVMRGLWSRISWYVFPERCFLRMFGGHGTTIGLSLRLYYAAASPPGRRVWCNYSRSANILIVANNRTMAPHRPNDFPDPLALVSLHDHRPRHRKISHHHRNRRQQGHRFLYSKLEGKRTAVDQVMGSVGRRIRQWRDYGICAGI